MTSDQPGLFPKKRRPRHSWCRFRWSSRAHDPSDADAESEAQSRRATLPRANWITVLRI